MLVGLETSRASDDFGPGLFARATERLFSMAREARSSSTAYISSQIFSRNIWFDFHRISQHPCHGIFAKNHNLLRKESQATRIGRKVYL